MKKQILFLLTTLFIMSATILPAASRTKNPAPSTPKRSSSSRSYDDEEDERCGLYVSCNVYGASVYLDGTYKGTTPLTIRNLKPGNYRLEVTKEHYSTDTSYIRLTTGRTKEAKCYLDKISGYLRIDTNPSNASIYVDGSLCSSYVELDEGVHKVMARKFGYNDTYSTVSINRNRDSSVTLILPQAEFNITSAYSEKNVFNPKNHGDLGNILMEFSVTAPGNGVIEITNEMGQVVYSQDISFNSWTSEAQWLGTDYQDYIVEDGRYTATLKAEGKEASFSFNVDSSVVYPMNVATPSGLGIGSVASAKLNPKSTFLLSLESGVFFKNTTKPFYGVPINLALSWTPANFLEITGNINGMISGDTMAYGFNLDMKFANHAGNFYYGALARIGQGSAPVFKPFGVDNYNGLGVGLLLGYDLQDLYIGAESTWIFRPVVGPFSKGNDNLWKNGVMVQKLFDSGSVGLYGSVTSGFGVAKTMDGEECNIARPVNVVDLGAKASFYMFSSSVSLGLQGGTYIFPENGFQTLFTETSKLYPYAKLSVTWMP